MPTDLKTIGMTTLLKFSNLSICPETKINKSYKKMKMRFIKFR